jgi:hypothetical protein
MGCFLGRRRRCAVSTVIADAATANGRSSFKVCRAVVMASALAVFPKHGVALRLWHVEFVPESSSVASPALLGDSVIGGEFRC